MLNRPSGRKQGVANDNTEKQVRVILAVIAVIAVVGIILAALLASPP